MSGNHVEANGFWIMDSDESSGKLVLDIKRIRKQNNHVTKVLSIGVIIHRIPGYASDTTYKRKSFVGVSRVRNGIVNPFTD